MKDGVLDAADVLIHREPAIDQIGVEDLRLIAWRDESCVVPRRIDEGVHRVRLPAASAAAFRTGGVEEAGVLRQRISLASRERNIQWQPDRQLLLGHWNDPAALTVDHRNRRAPVALPGDQPVAQAVANHSLAQA